MRQYTETARYGPKDVDCGDNLWKRLLTDIRLEKGAARSWIALDADVSVSSVTLVEEGHFSSLSKVTVLNILDKYFGSSYDSKLLQAILLLKLMEQPIPPIRTAPTTVRRKTVYSPKNRTRTSTSTWSVLLNRIRLEKDLSQADIAKRLGVNPITITRFETGKFHLLSKKLTASLLQEYMSSSCDAELSTAVAAAGLIEGTCTLQDAVSRLRAEGF